jgi:hypothetical protein
MITNCVRAPKHIPPQNFGNFIGNIVLIDVAIFFPSRRLCLHKKGFRRSTKLDSIGQYTNSHVHGQKLVVLLDDVPQVLELLLVCITSVQLA